MIFDSHAHYYAYAFDGDRDELLRKMNEEQDVKAILCPGENMPTSLKCVSLSESYGFVYAAVGVHPNYADTWQDSYADRLSEMLDMEKVVAVGEMGLDYYRRDDNRETQKRVFRLQLELAREKKKPAVIHDREAHGDMYDMLRYHRPEGVMHCFSGSVELAREALNLGLYIGLGGSVTALNAVKPVEVAKYVPLDRLVLETDAPYLIPRPYRNAPDKHKRSESWMIRCVAEFIAGLRHIDPEKLLDLTARNAATLYGVEL